MKCSGGLSRLVRSLTASFLAFICTYALAWGQTCLPNGDMTNDGNLSPSDVVLLLNKVFIDTDPPWCAPCPLPIGDLNCDGFRDMADVVLLDYCVFVGSAPLGPCPIPNVRPTVPDPQDSIIIESKAVTPGSGTPYTTLRVFITNKDNLAAVVLPIREATVDGSAYALVSAVGRLTNTLSGSLITQSNFYDGISPDRFIVLGIFDPQDIPGTMEPPNALRKALWEIKLNSVTLPSGSFGTVAFDSATGMYDNTIQFVDVIGRRIPVNFLKGALVVGNPLPVVNLWVKAQAMSPAKKGDWAWTKIQCKNLGNCPTGGTVIWTIPNHPLLPFQVVAYSTGGSAPQLNPGTRSVSWTLPILAVGQQIVFYARYKLPCAQPICGTLLTSVARAEPIGIELPANQGNNTFSETRTVIQKLPWCPCPLQASSTEASIAAVGEDGEKFVYPEGTVLPTDTLVYLIEFSNNGSGAVSDVVVRDTLDTDLDDATIETDGSSHPYTFSASGREVSWTFSGIGLPDSVTDEEGSMGFVAYTIRPKSTVQAGDEIQNYGILQFDAGQPFATAPVVNAICAGAKGDMNASGDLSPADVVLMLNCAFLGTGTCDNCYSDVNCSGDLSPSDVVIELNAVFLGSPFPC